jgi:hypothetical protein
VLSRLVDVPGALSGATRSLDADGRARDEGLDGALVVARERDDLGVEIS